MKKTNKEKEKSRKMVLFEPKQARKFFKEKRDEKQETKKEADWLNGAFSSACFQALTKKVHIQVRHSEKFSWYYFIASSNQ